MTKVKDSGHFCIVPFSTIILEPSGDIGICRLKGTEFSFGNIKDNTLEEIWNSPKLNEWRDEFISGNIDICSREMKHMRCHMCGKNNEMLKYVDFENLKKPKILL